MKNRMEDNQGDKQMTELELEIRRISDDRDQQISRAMAVLVMSAKTGPDADHLSQHTGYPREFVSSLIQHMEEGRLWRNGLLDDQEWWDENGELNGVALFTHAHVALGFVRRELTSYGASYFDTETGELVGEWRRSVH